MSKPSLFLKEAQKQNNALINLVAVEVSKVYLGKAQTGSSVSKYVLDANLSNLLIEESTLTSGDRGDGYAWVVSVEKGNDIGARRIVTGRSGVDLFFTPSLITTPVADYDQFRISKYMFLACWNQPVDFYLPDHSNTTDDIDIKYMPFPLSISPVGNTITGEIYNMGVSVSNVNRIIGNAIQMAGGLRGNRVIHLRVFYGLTNQGRDFSFQDIMYINTVSITQDNVEFGLESRLNILGIQIPTNLYLRDFCRFLFNSTECGYDGTSLDTDAYPMASSSSCDHTLRGPNGCSAHKNTRRFGGFPAIAAR